jgi:hypothetical protein
VARFLQSIVYGVVHISTIPIKPDKSKAIKPVIEYKKRIDKPVKVIYHNRYKGKYRGGRVWK